jgi:hypothetical protein
VLEVLLHKGPYEPPAVLAGADFPGDFAIRSKIREAQKRQQQQFRQPPPAVPARPLAPLRASTAMPKSR